MALALAATAGRAAAQEPAGPSRDSLFACVTREATAAGYRAVPSRRADRIAFMRTNESPGSTQLTDAIRAVVTTDSSATPKLDISVTTFVISGSTGLPDGEVAPRPSLRAMADSLRVRCHGRRS